MKVLTYLINGIVSALTFALSIHLENKILWTISLLFLLIITVIFLYEKFGKPNKE